MSQAYCRIGITSALQSSDLKTRCNALLGIALCEPEWKWAQNTLLAFLQNENLQTQRLCITGLGHIALATFLK